MLRDNFLFLKGSRSCWDENSHQAKFTFILIWERESDINTRGEKVKESKQDDSPICWFTPQRLAITGAWPSWSREPRSQISHMDERCPSTQTITCHLRGHRKLDQKQRNQDASQSHVLTACPLGSALPLTILKGLIPLPWNAAKSLGPPYCFLTLTYCPRLHLSHLVSALPCAGSCSIHRGSDQGDGCSHHSHFQGILSSQQARSSCQSSGKHFWICIHM